MAAFFFVCFVFLFSASLAEVCVENDSPYPFLDDAKFIGNYRTGLNLGGLDRDFGLFNRRAGLNFGGLDRDLGLFNRRAGLYRRDENLDLPFYGKNLNNFLGKSEADKSYRMDFFKDNFSSPKSRNQCACVCPNPIPKGDLTNPIVLDGVKNDLLNKLWNNKYRPQLTVLGQLTKFAILNLGNSNNEILKKHALAVSMFFFSYYPHKDVEFDLCPFIKVIDSYIAYKKQGDTQAIYESIDILGHTVLDSVQLIGSSAMYNTRCGIVWPKLANHNCDDDRQYRFEEMWQLEGHALPEFYRRAIFDLYRSDLYQDRLLAAIATAALSPQVNILLDAYDVYPMLELVNIQTIGPVPECCCSYGLNRLQELMGKSVREVTRCVQIVKDRIVRV